jgi:hypothetical protein
MGKLMPFDVPLGGRRVQLNEVLASVPLDAIQQLIHRHQRWVEGFQDDI